ncbi:MAG: glycosyltransferase family 4 protein [Anaerolineales bacterium]
MRILFVADGRSPIARGWISSVLALGHEVHVVSTYRCDPWPSLASLTVVPVAFSGLKSGDAGAGGLGGARQRAQLRHWLGPLTVPLAARSLRLRLATLKPDLVHALRVPFEGMMAAWAGPAVPLVVSIWGNDFSLHAAGSPLMSRLTRRTMANAAGVHADCQRDVRLAHRWGLKLEKPTVVLPGNGGVAPPFLAPDPVSGLESGSQVSELLSSRLDGEQPLVCNPRGLRAYVRNDVFFKSIPLVLAERPDVRFACPMMVGSRRAESWVARLSIESSVSLLGRLNAVEMAALLARSQVMVSPSEHDGTPNSLLEAMACGAFPVAGDLESLREWIDDGENGLLIDPSDPQALAKAILAALADPAWRRRAAAANRRLIETRAARQRVQEQVERFYQEVVAFGGTG